MINLKVAVTGSKTFTDYPAMDRILKDMHPALIISGGSPGADSLAHRWANENKVPVQIFLPDWKTHRKKANVVKKMLMINAAQALVAFLETKDMKPPAKGSGILKLAEKKGITVFLIEEKPLVS